MLHFYSGFRIKKVCCTQLFVKYLLTRHLFCNVFFARDDVFVLLQLHGNKLIKGNKVDSK